MVISIHVTCGKHVDCIMIFADTCVYISSEQYPIDRFHSRDYRPYWFTETKESICIKIEFNSQRFSLGHQHGRHFFVLGHQHGRRDVSCLISILNILSKARFLITKCLDICSTVKLILVERLPELN